MVLSINRKSDRITRTIAGLVMVRGEKGNRDEKLENDLVSRLLNSAPSMMAMTSHMSCILQPEDTSHFS